MTEHLQSQIDAIRALMDVGCSFQEAVAGLNCEPGPWELSLGESNDQS